MIKRFKEKWVWKFTLEDGMQNALNHKQYRGADKSLARPTSRCIFFDGQNISFDASLVLYIYKQY